MPITITRKAKAISNVEPESIVHEEPMQDAPSAQPITLDVVVARIRSTETLTPARRNELVSACHSTARLASLPPKDIVVTATNLRAIFAKTKFGTAGMSQKRYANIRSGVARACTIAGALPPAIAHEPKSEAWAAFLDSAHKPFHAWTLARFAQFCDLSGIKPDEATDTELRLFEQELEGRTILNTPTAIRRATAIAYNRICKDNGLSTYPVLTARMGRAYVSPDLTTYPQSMQDDIQTFLERCAVTDRFEDFNRGGVYQPVSIRNVKNQLRQLLDAAVLGGVPKSSLIELSALMERKVWTTAFEKIRSRIGKAYPTTLTNMARMLIVIARHHVHAPEDQLQELRKASKKIAQMNGLAVREMGKRSKEIMKQFECAENIAAVLNLPEALIKSADSRRRKYDGAMDAMVAAAIATLVSVPMRMRNISSLNLATNLSNTATQPGKSKYRIDIAANDTKNKVQIDAEIVGDEAMLVAHYVKFYRSQLCLVPTQALFPRPDGSPRDPGKLGELISKRIEKHTGLMMTAHCFRHLAAKIYLDAHPGNYEDVRRILGHKTVKTTIDFYSPRETTSAQNMYHESLSVSKKGRVNDL